MLETIRRFRALAVHLLAARSVQEREERRAHVFALLLVLAVAIAKSVSGLTGNDAPFTLFIVAIGASAARGGVAPALVATLASILFAGLGAVPPATTQARLLFGVEGLFVALIVSGVRSQLHASQGRLRATAATIAQLRGRDRHGRVLEAALRHLEETSGETAVVVLDEHGLIAGWHTSAERLYGHTARDIVGTSAHSLFLEPIPQGDFRALLREAAETGSVRRSAAHGRLDGSAMDVEFEVKPFRRDEARGFTVAVYDTARRREWEEYRQAAAVAQSALQRAADETRQQLTAIENLTDPALNPFGGAAMVSELLERLREAVRADGAALVQPGRLGVVTARGLQPMGGPSSAEVLRLAPGRVAVVHNDPARVEQLSALHWPAEVSSLLVVPVVHDGQVWSTIEVVGERSRQMSDWEVALARVVADRLAAVVVHGRGFASKAS